MPALVDSQVLLRLCPTCAGRVWLTESTDDSPEHDMIEANKAVDDYFQYLGLQFGVATGRDKAMWVAGYRAGLIAERKRQRLKSCTVLLGMI